MSTSPFPGQCFCCPLKISCRICMASSSVPQNIQIIFFHLRRCVRPPRAPPGLAVPAQPPPRAQDPMSAPRGCQPQAQRHHSRAGSSSPQPGSAQLQAPPHLSPFVAPERCPMPGAGNALLPPFLAVLLLAGWWDGPWLLGPACHPMGSSQPTLCPDTFHSCPGHFPNSHGQDAIVFHPTVRTICPFRVLQLLVPSTSLTNSLHQSPMFTSHTLTHSSHLILILPQIFSSAFYKNLLPRNISSSQLLFPEC